MNTNDDIESKLVAIWRSQMQDGFNLSANFFDSGGTSIRAINLIFEINKEFKTTYTVIDLLNNPTIKEFSRLVTNS